MNFNFKKKYGQNFISDKALINKISLLIDAKEDDLIIEIGPGAGALTSKLTQLNSYYIAYEIDTELDEYLSRYSSSKFKIIYDDFLKRDIKKDIKDIKYNRLFIVGNLPYYITTPIMMKLIDDEIESTKNVFMVQKEFGDRLIAKPRNREYGSITVLMNYFYDIKQEFIVNKEKFNPKPKVDSCILSFTNKEDKAKFSTMIVGLKTASLLSASAGWPARSTRLPAGSLLVSSCNKVFCKEPCKADFGGYINFFLIHNNPIITYLT